MSALLDDDDRDETERFQVTTFETCCAVSTEIFKINSSSKHYDNERKSTIKTRPELPWLRIISRLQQTRSADTNRAVGSFPGEPRI